MITKEPTDAFDLPDHCELDHVMICAAPDDDEHDYVAVPFYRADTFDDGTRVYDEPLRHRVTDAYRQAVDNRADADLDNIRLQRDYGVTHGEPA